MSDKSQLKDTYPIGTPLNIVEFEYLLLESLRYNLSDARINREMGETKFQFRLADNKRAVVRLEIVPAVTCKDCGGEIDFPTYTQLQPDKNVHSGVYQKCTPKTSTEDVIDSD